MAYVSDRRGGGSNDAVTEALRQLNYFKKPTAQSSGIVSGDDLVAAILDGKATPVSRDSSAGTQGQDIIDAIINGPRSTVSRNGNDLIEAMQNGIPTVPPSLSKNSSESQKYDYSDVRDGSIERLLADRRKRESASAEKVEPPYDDGNLAAINALMELAGNMPAGSSSPGIDISGIMKQAANAAGRPFSAQIKSTRGQNQRAKADTDYSSKEIRKMYRALARSNKNSARRESNQTQEMAASIQQQSAESADKLEADNKSRLDASAAGAAALGSGDLATSLASEINANTSEGARQLAETANNAAVAMTKTGDAQRRYLNASGDNAKLIGTNRAADLYGDLQDYLQGNRDKISELRGQRAAAVGQAQQAAAAAASQAQSDSYEQEYRAHQDLLKNQMALLGMKTDLQERDFQQSVTSQELAMALRKSLGGDATTGGFPQGLLDALPQDQRSALQLQQYLSPEAGANLSEIMKNPALAQGYYTNSEGNKIPLGGNALNSQNFLAGLGMTSNNRMDNLVLSNLIAALASGNTDLPYGAQRTP